ncbi:MAG: hypothetical protein JXA82_06815 [Sedimentisphaerales bacterium]|nr:hypothetical protein [Sedimentisphaerales bacterium]
MKTKMFFIRTGAVTRRLCLVFLVAILLGCLAGCGSMAIDRMMAAAEKGLAAAEKNDQMLVESLQKQIQTEIQLLNKGLDRDIDLVASGQLKQSDGETVVFDAEWVKQMRTGYYLALESKYKQLQELERKGIQIQGNLKTVRNLMQESRDLNTGYLSRFRKARNLLDRSEEASASE